MLISLKASERCSPTVVIAIPVHNLKTKDDIIARNFFPPRREMPVKESLKEVFPVLDLEFHLGSLFSLRLLISSGASHSRVVQQQHIATAR